MEHGVPGEESAHKCVLQRPVHLADRELLQLAGEQQRVLDKGQVGGAAQSEGGGAQLLKGCRRGVGGHLSGLHRRLQPSPVIRLGGVVAVGDGDTPKAGAAGPDHKDGAQIQLVHTGQLQAG